MIPEIVIVNLTGHPLTQQIYRPEEYYILRDMGVIPEHLEDRVKLREGGGNFIEIDEREFCKV